jgi:cell wall-associated NlpC family hydrolase
MGITYPGKTKPCNSPIAMPSRQAIIDEARRHLGTRFLHQGRQPRTNQFEGGLDCAGLIVCTAKALNLDNGFTEFPYGRYPHAARLERTCNAHMDRIPLDQARPGDVLLMAWRTEPQHLAILTDIGIIHSLGEKAVVEHALDPVWRSRIKAAYRFRGLA